MLKGIMHNGLAYSNRHWLLWVQSVMYNGDDMQFILDDEVISSGGLRKEPIDCVEITFLFILLWGSVRQ